MISVEQATELLKKHCVQVGVESLLLEEVLGKILQEDIYADRAAPPYDRVAMDGIAINCNECKELSSLFFCEGIARAGEPRKKKEKALSYFHVSTGAVLPEGVDTVLPFEDLTFDGDTVSWDVIPKRMMNIDAKGEEHLQGSILLHKGKKITVQDIALLASVGKSIVKVSVVQKVVIITTGDELVHVHEIPKEHEIRISNAIQGKALLQSHGFTNVDICYCKDTEQETRDLLNKCVNSYDMLIFIGGISAGKYDFVKIAVEHNNIEQIFYHVAQRPGKPLFFGLYNNSVPIFAIPGNPVAFLACLRRFVIVYLYLCAGFLLEPSFRTLGDSFTFNKDLTRFLFARTSSIDASLLPMIEVSPGNLYSLTESIGFFELPAQESLFSKGNDYIFHYWVYV
ncbi:MAG: molybdopterin molybdotransferase MoeA [Desulfovibrionaceae bacterium]